MSFNTSKSDNNKKQVRLIRLLLNLKTFLYSSKGLAFFIQAHVACLLMKIYSYSTFFLRYMGAINGILYTIKRTN